MEYFIELKVYIKLIKTSLPRYTLIKREFINRIFLKLKNVDIIL